MAASKCQQWACHENRAGHGIVQNGPRMDIYNHIDSEIYFQQEECSSISIGVDMARDGQPWNGHWRGWSEIKLWKEPASITKRGKDLVSVDPQRN